MSKPYTLSDIDALNKCCRALDQVDPQDAERIVHFLQARYHKRALHDSFRDTPHEKPSSFAAQSAGQDDWTDSSPAAPSAPSDAGEGA